MFDHQVIEALEQSDQVLASNPVHHKNAPNWEGSSAYPRGAASVHFLSGGVVGVPPLLSAVPWRKSSKLTPAGEGASTTARLVVKPIKRPIIMMPIHMA